MWWVVCVGPVGPGEDVAEAPGAHVGFGLCACGRAHGEGVGGDRGLDGIGSQGIWVGKVGDR